MSMPLIYRIVDMKKLYEIFKKQGGVNLIKQYLLCGTFFTAINQFFVLGKSRTALEILRLSTSLKAKCKLEKKYKNKIEELLTKYDVSKNKEKGTNIWFCWFQGLENAPEIVKVCFLSLNRHIKDKNVVLITENNYQEYVCFPEFIQEKVDKGMISKTHLSDLLRLELLLKYGGTWIDATVLCTDDNIPEYMLNSELFMFQCLKPGRDGHVTVMSNWFISAYSNNKILFLTRELLYEYWKEKNVVVDYFIFHIFMQMAIEKCPEEWNKVTPVSNSTPHILLLRLFEKYDGRMWDNIVQQIPFHKLSYKCLKESHDTYYDYIINHYGDNGALGASFASGVKCDEIIKNK